MGSRPGFLWGEGMPGRPSPGCGPVHVLDHHLSPSPQTLETHLALCSSPSRKLIQKYFSKRIQQQVGAGWCSHHLPTSHLAHRPCLWKWELSPPPSHSWGCWGRFIHIEQEGAQCIPEDSSTSWYPKIPAEPLPGPVPPLHDGDKDPSLYLILVPHCPAGHQLREVRGRDHQSSVPAFGAETPCGSAQRHQPHPTGLQRWVWVARGATLLQGPLSLVPRQERCWQSLGSPFCFAFLCKELDLGEMGVIALVLGGSMGCVRQDHAGHSAHIPLFVAQTSSWGRRLFFIIQSSHRSKNTAG